MSIVAEQPIETISPDPAPAEVVISVRNVGKMYRIYDRPQDRLKQMLLWRFGRHYGREFWALRGVSFEVRKGETVGIIGRNGSGKSTLLQMIAGTLTPSTGEVQVNGRVAALLELGSGFNPEFTGRENVFMNGAILGLSQEEMEARFDEIAAFADIGEFIDQPVKFYSSGMVVRLAFAVSSCIEPDILIVDEALAVGDISFQARCLDKIKSLTARGTTTLFVTHDTGTFQNLCDHGYLLDRGRLLTHGRPSHVAMQYYELMRESEHARQRLAAAPEQAVEVREELQHIEDTIAGKAESGEYRFGTGTARIVGYRILNASGEETNTLQVGKPFSVSVEIAFHDRVNNLSVGIMLRNAQGQNLMGMHSYHEHRVSFGNMQSGNEIEVTCRQDMLLNPGDYLLNIGLADCRSDYDFTTLDSRNSISKITVYGKGVSYGLVDTRPAFYWRSTRHNFNIETIESVYNQQMSAPRIAPIVQEILRFDEAPPTDDDPFEKEERSWPGEPRFVQIGYHRRMLGRYLFAGSEFCRGARVLETCSGLGWGAYLIAQYARDVTAFDLDQVAVDNAAQLWRADNIQWLTGDARQLDFLNDEVFDVALGMESIEHLSFEDGSRYIREVAGRLRRGGVFIGTSAFPETREEAERIRSTNPYHLHIFTRAELTKLLVAHFSECSIIANWMFIAIK
jgi:ABC-type polysaccharide/polyol phosphate transport system ATPase subunit/SAM-dependent methyltransferase